MKFYNFFLFFAMSSLLTSGCTKWTAGEHKPEDLKESSFMWGVPKSRPVVWGFTGIDRSCTEKDPCPSQNK